jgi:hypothetical protein
MACGSSTSTSSSTAATPATRQRVETRLLVRGTNGTYGVSVPLERGNGTEAFLVPDGGVALLTSTITNNGHSQRRSSWQIPQSQRSAASATSPGRRLRARASAPAS